MHWVIYALCTVACWGLYGAYLGQGAAKFEHDRMKAFFFVGIAYFLIAVLAPAAVIAINGKGFDFGKHPDGVKLSLFAGALGAVGALTALFALSNNPVKPPPLAASQVMSVIFAGAPIVAAIYGLMNREKGFSELDWRFIAGLVMAAAGGCMVTLFKPS